ncbi:hypothetical protein ACIGQE_08415 [Streptomyces sp. NPDC053429]|uniref:hypothetical protein n=1 Tax=unclassified Streptomyces TaxID=2593676 RepID=UPI0033CA707B
MKFAQIIDFETEREDEVRALLRSYEEQTRSQSRENGPNSRLLLKDRENPRRFLAVVEFDSYEKAMANSSAPETGELAGRLSELMTRPPVYTDCDVVDRADMT